MSALYNLRNCISSGDEGLSISSHNLTNCISFSFFCNARLLSSCRQLPRIVFSPLFACGHSGLHVRKDSIHEYGLLLSGCSSSTFLQHSRYCTCRFSVICGSILTRTKHSKDRFAKPLPAPHCLSFYWSWESFSPPFPCLHSDLQVRKQIPYTNISSFYQEVHQPFSWSMLDISCVSSL